MLFLALFACASEPTPVLEAPEPPVAAAPAPALPVQAVGFRPVPIHAVCTFDGGAQAEVTMVSKWPTTLDLRVGDRTVRVDPTTPGYDPYEYMGDVAYTFRVSFEALDASWAYTVSGLAPDEYYRDLSRTVGGVTAIAKCAPQ